MKKSHLFIAEIAVAALLFSCMEQKRNPKISIDSEHARDSYGEKCTIEPQDDSVKITRGRIILSPEEENATYTISGYFNGQIVSETKNTILRLNNAYLENTTGKPVVSAKAKIEISTEKDSTNYIVMRGRSFSKIGAIQTKRDLVLGGSGTLFVKGGVCHGIDSEDVKLKGSGVFYIEGTKRGSALTCHSFTVENGKTFSAYFLNAKNGIKVDDAITIQSGTFHLYDNDTAFKTDLAKKSSDKSHFVSLVGGTFYTHQNGALYETDKFTTEVEMIEK